MNKLPAIRTYKKIHFALSTKPGSRVFVAGTFNRWSPTLHPLKDNPDSGHFKTAVSLPKGKHEYKFVVDGEWTADPICSSWAPNAYGTINSVLYV